MAMRMSTGKIFFIAAMMLCTFLLPVLSIAADPSAGKPLPNLLLSGALDDTVQGVMPCTPLRIQYSVRDTGTIPASSGFLTVEIKSAGTGRSVFVRMLPFTMGANSVMIENVTFPQGAYTVLLKASVSNQEFGIARQFTLAEKALTVSAPILVKKSSDAIPGVILWLNRNGTATQKAFAELIIEQAFDEDDSYYTTVETKEDFMEEAMSGEFNTLVLFETDELLDRTDWLMDRLSRGQGLVIIGSEDRTRMIAETLGFKFREAPPSAGALLQLTEESGMGLAGTLPVSGRILQPQKKSAKAAALFAGDKKPAILIDKAGLGRVIVMPFSFTRSALDTGATSLYSLLLRTAVRIVTPENDKRTGVSSIELMVSAPSGPVRARVIESLPPGTKVIWMNTEGTEENNAIHYDLTVDKEPQKLLYLYQIPAGSKTPAFTEVFFDCNGKLVSQGKIE